MEWIDKEVEFPNLDKILCYSPEKIFICELLETKWGNHYLSTETEYENGFKQLEWTHWMPLPKPPETRE